MATHKIRSFGASILLIAVLAILSYVLMPGLYGELLSLYPGQGERAYVIAFTDVFLYYLLSSGSTIVMLVITFILAFLLLKTWGDGLLAGLLSGIVVSLLALYILKNYFPEVLEVGGLAVILERLWLGIVSGSVIGLHGALGGVLRQRIGMKQPRIDQAGLAAEKSKCPKCGTVFESDPEICSNCGRRLRRTR